MRKFVVYFIIYITGLMVQFAWAKYLSPYGLAPNFLLVCLISVGLLRGPLESEFLGFAWGISWDALSTEMFGCHAFLFTCLGYFSGMLSRKWNESKISAQILLTLFASLFFMLGMKAVYMVFGGGEFVYSFNYVNGTQPLYNIIIAPVVFWAGKKLKVLVD
jgi:rod shape-determining protein MreD